MDLLLGFPQFPALGRRILVSRVVLLPCEALALAGGHHVDLVYPGAAVVALQLDPLGPGSVYDAAPVRGITTAPVPLRETTDPDPVGGQVSWQTLPGTHQFFDWADAGALTIRDVLCGSEFPAFHLALVRAWNNNEMICLGCFSLVSFFVCFFVSFFRSSQILSDNQF